MNPVFKFFSSLWLTVVLLAFCILLVFFGTLDQVHWGIHETQRRYFESLYVFWQYPLEWPKGQALRWIHLPLPGGYTLGSLLLINLVCAHFRFFRPGWKRLGIAVTHLGVVILLVSGFLISAFQKESQMWIKQGETSNYATDYRANELVVIDRSHPDYDEVTTIPESLLAEEGIISLNELGLRVRVIDFMPNALLASKMQNPTGPDPRADRGAAARMGMFAIEQPQVYAEDEVNTTSAIVELIGPDGSLGTWLVSNYMDQPGIPAQTFELNGKTYELMLRFHRTYLPFSLQLDEFSHDVYPGTETPKNFSSEVQIITPGESGTQPALIYMNHPLRHEGYTFFQHSFRDARMTPDQIPWTSLQVVQNPVWQMPYYAVAIVGIGMCIQFLIRLVGFANRFKKAAA